MATSNRVVDINGGLINEPKHYHESLDWGKEMLDKMDDAGIDRSDMAVVLQGLFSELTFHLRFLPKRG